MLWCRFNFVDRSRDTLPVAEKGEGERVEGNKKTRTRAKTHDNSYWWDSVKGRRQTVVLLQIVNYLADNCPVLSTGVSPGLCKM